MQQNNGVGRSQLISFAVFSLILMGVMFYFQSKQKPEEQAKTQVTQSAQKSNAAQLQNNANAAGIQKVQLKNDLLTVDFTTLGGQISTVRLNKFNAFDEKTKDKPLLLFSNNNADYGFQFKDKSGKVINTKDLVFNATANGNAITMQANVGAATIQFVYTLLDKYTVDFKVRTQGLSQLVSDNKADFVWNYNVREAEKGRSQEQTHTEFVYAFNNYKAMIMIPEAKWMKPKKTLTGLV
jgi:YidC/Oxa1 family membrane protein insertase